MSNVLIGIIGVILFIGLALAGALILGDDFKQSRAASRAAAESTRLRQIAQAIQMKNLKTGTVHPSGRVVIGALAPRFLKTGVNVDNANGWGYVDARGPDGELDGLRAATWVVSGAGGAEARAACAAAAETTGLTLTAAGDPPTLGRPRGDSGCYLSTGEDFNVAAGVYVMFQRV